MFSYIFIITIISGTFAGYSESSENSGNEVGGGSAYGYSGSFSGGVPPNFPIPPIPDFASFFDSLAKYHQQFIANLQQQISSAQAAGGQGAPGFYGGGYGGSYGGGVEGAARAGASIGPGGIHQVAAVFPENPNNPNIETRFGAPPAGEGSYGVFTSSFSSSSNDNGKPTSFHRATTTVNDNGKITTYTVKNP